MASKTIIVELNKDEKLNGDNYDIWHCMFQYILEEQDVLETLNHVMIEPTSEDTHQHEREIYLELFKPEKKKNSISRITLLGSMGSELMCEFVSE